MLSVFLSRTNDDHGVWLRLPSTPSSLGEAYARLDPLAPPGTPTLITGVMGVPEHFLDYLKGYTPDDPEQLRKLEAFAVQYGEYTTMQRDLLSGALDAENSETIEDVLRVMEHLDQYQALPNIYDTKELGFYLVEEGVVQVERSAWQYLDYEKVGGQYEKGHPGAYVDGFYICKKEETPQTHHPARQQPVFDLRLYTSRIGETRPGPYRLTLPASEKQLDRAVEVLGVTLFDECTVEGFECQISGLTELFSEAPMDVEAMNELAEKISALQERNELNKLLAVLEVERPDTFAQAVDLAANLADYELCDRDIGCAAHYGEYVLYDSGRYEHGYDFMDEVRDFIDFEKYGEYKMAEDGIRQTLYGMLRRISEPFPPEQQGQYPVPSL